MARVTLGELENELPNSTFGVMIIQRNCVLFWRTEY